MACFHNFEINEATILTVLMVVFIFSLVKVSGYIDGANLFHAGEDIGLRIDYSKLKSMIEQKRVLVDLNYYDMSEDRPSERAFFMKLQGFGYNLKIVPLRRYGSQPVEKKIDTQIVADSLVDAFNRKFDVAVFGSGDKDILPAVEYLLQMKKQVEIMSFEHTLAWDLKKSGARMINLTKIQNQIRRI